MMGGVVRAFRKFTRKVAGETLKATGLMPSKKEVREQQEAMAAAAPPPAAAVDAPEPPSPDDVIYAGEQEGEAPKKKKRRKSAGTILTGSQGVMGAAPTEKKSLLGG
tara:strand:- start:924 stop:1244 length:321 start_codon:yes stop_codon:yes gene_type:complete